MRIKLMECWPTFKFALVFVEFNYFKYFICTFFHHHHASLEYTAKITQPKKIHLIE
jgi:hypothetical protein